MSNQDTPIPLFHGIINLPAGSPRNVNLANGVPLEQIGPFGSQELPSSLPPRPISLSQT